MISHMYPNVNKHIFSQRPASDMASGNSYHSEFSRPHQAEEPLPKRSPSSSSEAILACRPRTSAPPPYSEADPTQTSPDYQLIQAAASSSNKKKENAAKKAPSLLLEVAVGHRLAQVISKKRQEKREAKLEQVHDAWARLGLNTRLIAAQGGELPPHFWSPPQCSAEELNAELAKLCP